MTCPAEINRRYPTRDEAWGYLASRGFRCTTAGWRNGHWVAAVERDTLGFRVRACLPSVAATA